MTADQAAETEKMWQLHNQAVALKTLLVRAKIPDTEYQAALHLHQGDSMTAVKAVLALRALAGDRGAALEMCHLSLDTNERERWNLLLIELDLARLAAIGIQFVQLSAGGGADKLCPACRPLNQRIISVHDGARAVIPVNCSCATKGSLMVHGWIKRKDGTGYVAC